MLVVKSLLANAGDLKEMWARSLVKSPEGGNGRSLQYSCLGNPIDRGARSATVPEHSTAEPFYNKHLSSTKQPPWEDVSFPK